MIAPKQFKLILPANAREMFNGKKSIMSDDGTFRQYKKLVSRNKRLEPFLAIRDGKNKYLDRGLMATLNGIDKENAQRAFEKIKSAASAFTSQNVPTRKNQERLESLLKSILAEEMPGYKAKLTAALNGRSELIFNQIEPFIDGLSLLDIGSGEGMVSKLAQEKTGISVVQLDVIDNNRSGLPLVKFDGKTIPFGDRAFDTSLVLTVFHHADNPIELLGETVRVTNSRIIVIESVSLNSAHRGAQAFGDWFYNRVLHDNDVNCPLNFQPITGWLDTFKQFPVRLSDIHLLGLDMKLAPEFHVRYVLEKTN